MDQKIRVLFSTDDLRPRASEEDLDASAEYVRRMFGTRLPDDSLAFLRTADGYDSQR
jgi:hypothetical protein